MSSSFTFGHIAGIPLKVHLNWFLVAALVSWSLAAGYFPQEYPGWSGATYWTVGLVTSLLFFVSVLLHELGHSMVALREEVPVNSITLFIFGGVAHIGHEPTTPKSEFRIVVAGPLTSLLLAGGFGLISIISFLGPQITGGALYLSRINVILAVFNMIPGFPLDGGRILRACIWRINHNFHRATWWAANIGLGIALLFVAAGFIAMLMGNFISGLWLGFIGWYLSVAAQEGYRQAIPENYDSAEPGSAQGVEYTRLAGWAEKTRPSRSSLPPQAAQGMGRSFALAEMAVHQDKFPFIHSRQPTQDGHSDSPLNIE